MKEIKLNKFKGAPNIALVSDEDFEMLNAFNWSLDANGYAIRFPGIKMHRVVAGALAGQEVDHINGNRADNRRDNLRICTRAENQHNQRPRAGKYKGVTYILPRNRYMAQIVVGMKRKTLGYRKTPEDAARLYDTAAKNLFGEFANLNFPEPQCATV